MSHKVHKAKHLSRRFKYFFSVVVYKSRFFCKTRSPPKWAEIILLDCPTSWISSGLHNSNCSEGDVTRGTQLTPSVGDKGEHPLEDHLSCDAKILERSLAGNWSAGPSVPCLQKDIKSRAS